MNSNYCGTLQDLHTAIKKECPSMLTMGVTMWLALPKIYCTTCTRRCWTILHRAWICHHVTSMHLALSKKCQRAAHSCQTAMAECFQQQLRQLFVCVCVCVCADTIIASQSL
jgi:hypothetical protein